MTGNPSPGENRAVSAPPLEDETPSSPSSPPSPSSCPIENPSGTVDSLIKRRVMRTMTNYPPFPPSLPLSPDSFLGIVFLGFARTRARAEAITADIRLCTRLYLRRRPCNAPCKHVRINATPCTTCIATMGGKCPPPIYVYLHESARLSARGNRALFYAYAYAGLT